MKISEILKVVITIVKYIVISYFILNLVAYIYFYMMIQPRETPMAEKHKLAVDVLQYGNAFLYGLLSDIIQGKRLYGDNTQWPYNAVSYNAV